jgi:DNA-binding XRE family transcriptional regulator
MELKKQRLGQRLSQMKLAKLAGVSRFRIHLAENDYIQLAKDELMKIKSAIQTAKRKRGNNVE